MAASSRMALSDQLLTTWTVAVLKSVSFRRQAISGCRFVCLTSSANARYLNLPRAGELKDIKAMKVMNEIKAELSGTIAEVVAESGKPVQFGQVLFRVR